ncbi:MAG: SusC/RagA family TonB-linked outer membrane protein [Bacteroidetes bacterium]|nr:SusC/RagA family TonB-linked outer membrane protein [Bacteroidota bacterium]
MRKTVSLFAVLMLCIVSAFSQNKTVTGQVTNSDGGPIPYASIKIKGENTGVAADQNGKFSIVVNSRAILTISAAGFESQDIAIGDRSAIAVSLVSSANLQEVVITALGVKRNRNDLAYAAQSVNADAIEKASQTDALKALSGKIAGVQITSSTGTPGGAAYIQLRGANSITGDNQPLFVIDGVPVDNGQNYSGDPSDGTNNVLFGATNTNRGADINPNDIESITVLKGPAAAALYGIGAANGAIIIITKSGKAGKIQVEFNSTVSFDKVNRLPGLQNQWVKGSGGTIGKFPSSNRYSWGAKADTLMWTGVPNDFDIHGQVVGKSNPGAKVPFTPYDNMRNFFRTAPSFTNSIAFSGGNDIATYRMGYTNLYQNSIVPTQFFQRNSLSFAGSLKISEKIKASTNINYTRSNSTQPQNGSNLSGIMLGLTRTPINFDNSNGATNAEDPKAYMFPVGSDYAGLQRAYRFNGASAIYDNPYWTINKTPYTTDLDRIIGNVQLDYNIGSGFSALYRLGTDIYQDNREQYYDIGSSAYNGGRIFYDRYTYKSLNSDLILSYSKKLSESFKFDGKIGQNFYSSKLNELYTQGDGLVASDYNNMDNATVVKSSNFVTPYRRSAVYFDLNFDYASLLFLEITGRNDWSSTLPVDKRSFFYPSASLGFVFTRLGGMQNDVLNYGKLRLSAAQVGKDAPSFALNSYYSKATFSDGYTTGITYPNDGVAGFGRVTTLGNPNLKPEKTTSYEAGLDLQFFRNRLGLDATVYYSKGQDLIVTAPLASTTGYMSQVINSGSIETKGIELQFTVTPVLSKNFRWDAFVNYSSYKNKILKLAEGVKQINLNGFTGTTISQIAGYGAASVFGYGYERDSQGNIVVDDSPGDAQYYPIAPSIQKFLGNTNPKFLLGFGNTFTYKGLSLYALFDWKQGGVMWNGTRGSLTAIGTSDNTNNRGDMHLFEGVLGHLNDVGKLVHYDGNGNEVDGPGAVNKNAVPLNEGWYLGNGGGFGNLNEAFIEDASYVKLREASVSYDFSSVLKGGRFLKGASLGAFVRNIIVWTPYKGIDPETSLTGATSAQGMDYFNMPGTSSFGMNLKLRF